MGNRITHTGIIDSIEGQHIRVRIVQQSACASCKVASRCNVSEAKDKIVDVYTNTSHYSIGQQVTVSTSSDAVKQALLIGFGLPLLLLSSVLVTAKMCGSSDGWAALLALGVLFPYYIFVWLIKDLIAKRISFNIE